MTDARAAPAPVRRRAGVMVLGELRFRLVARRLRSRGGAAEAIAQWLVYLLALPAALAFAGLIGFGSYRAARAVHGVQVTVTISVILYGLWQLWTAVALTLNERDSLDLRRLLVYPVPPWRMYLLGLVTSLVADPLALFWLVLLAGMVTGASLGRPGPWVLALGALLIAFAAATVSLIALAQELLVRLARRRRWRELVALVAVAGWLAVVFTTSGGGRALRAARPAWRVLRWTLYPAALASEGARRLYAQQTLAALPWLVGLLAAAAVAGGLAYRLALATARSGGEAVSGGASGESGRRYWPDGLGPLFEKEVLYLLRHPAARIYLVLLPALAALLGWKLPVRAAGELSGLAAVLPLFGLAAYVHLALQMFWVNALGWERGGARALFLAPIAPERILAAKNMALVLYATVLFAASAGAYVALAGPPPLWAAAGALALELGLAPLLYGAGNVVTIALPRSAAFGVQRAGSVSALAALAGMGITSSALALFALPVLAALWLDALWLIPASWTALGAAGAATWRATLPAAGRLLERRKEAVLAVVCGDDA